MEQFLEMLNNEYVILGVIIVNIILLILFIGNSIKLKSINKKYTTFLKKLGNGENIEEDIKVYINKVEKVENTNKEIIEYCENLEKELSKSIKKIGIVRYNAFKDTGSDLSFALALLNDDNNGVVLNGIYSREMSNIYAKPIVNGQSKYTISDREQEAINKAIASLEYKISDK